VKFELGLASWGKTGSDEDDTVDMLVFMLYFMALN